MYTKTYTCAACSTPTGPMWQATINGYTWEFCDACHTAIANTPVASQEPQDSPIVARVSELLGETL